MIFQNAELHNITELVFDPIFKDYQMMRIPHPLKNMLHERAQRASEYCCGCEIRFRMISDEVTIHLRRTPVSDRILKTGVLEIYQGDLQGSYEISPPILSTEPTAIKIKRLNWSNLKLLTEKNGYTYHPELTRVLLPYDWGCAISSIEGEISPPYPEDLPEKTLLLYGSSISHGGNSSTPSGTYAMNLARMLHMDLENLGSAGSAYMETPVAEYIANKKNWDMALIELGVNVVEQWSVKTFHDTASRFLDLIASKHPHQKIFCTDIYLNYLDFKSDSQTTAFRDCLESVVTKELNHKNLFYLNGLSMLTDVSGLSSDGLHPANSGHNEIAQNLYKSMK